MKIEYLQNCTGCHACYSACPKAAIRMVADDKGFLYPSIEKENCVACGLCENVCPVLHPHNKNSEDTKAFAAINKDEKIRLESSSGGIFTALAEKIIASEGGIVFGARFSDDFSVVHSWTDSVNGLADFRGSKYVQSAIGENYKDCKNFLEAGRKVLFTGTPCQIAGLKNYLHKKYENLLCADIICHGVPSPLVWQKYIDFRVKKFGATRQDMMKTAFRRKDDGWKQFSLSFTFANESEYCNVASKDPYMQLFLRDICLRESCYVCPCKTLERCADITLADFWGIQSVLPALDDNKGTSLVITHSKKGECALQGLDNCIVTEVSVVDGIKENSAMVHSANRPMQRDSFFHAMHSQSFGRVVNKYAFPPRWKVCTVKMLHFFFGKDSIAKVKKFLKRKQ